MVAVHNRPTNPTMQFDYTRSPSISTVPPSASLLPSPAHPGIPYIWRTYHPNVSPYIDSHGVTWVPLALRQSQPAHSPPLHYPNYTLAATPPSISQLFSTQPLPQLPYSTSPRFSEPIWANDLMRDQRRASELNIVEQIRQDQTSRRAGWKSVLEFVKESCPEGERELVSRLKMTSKLSIPDSSCDRTSCKNTSPTLTASSPAPLPAPPATKPLKPSSTFAKSNTCPAERSSA